ncbi:MAG: AAA family ATPase [bacterium]
MIEFEKYLEFWSLKEKPFEETRSPRFFFESNEHVEALNRLCYLVKDKGMLFGMLTGEIGCGKTIISILLEKRISPKEIEMVRLENSNFAFNDLMFEIINRIKFQQITFEMDKKHLFENRNDKYYLMKIMKEHLEHLDKVENRHLVIIFDEAHQIKTHDLEEINNLANINSQENSQVSIILVGQSELRDRIKIMEQLDQRIGVRFHLHNFDRENTHRYIEHRLKAAGYKEGCVFDQGALLKIFEHSKGAPRAINRIAKLSMEYCFATKEKTVNENVIKIITDDIADNTILSGDA